eukprot:932415-Rhodomonas_salina.1
MNLAVQSLQSAEYRRVKRGTLAHLLIPTKCATRSPLGRYRSRSKGVEKRAKKNPLFQKHGIRTALELRNHVLWDLLQRLETGDTVQNLRPFARGGRMTTNASEWKRLKLLSI